MSLKFGAKSLRNYFLLQGPHNVPIRAWKVELNFRPINWPQKKNGKSWRKHCITIGRLKICRSKITKKLRRVTAWYEAKTCLYDNRRKVKNILFWGCKIWTYWNRLPIITLKKQESSYPSVEHNESEWTIVRVPFCHKL